MIRTVTLALAIVVGMIGAVVWQGRIYHAKAVLPELLPAWTSQVANDAGLITGKLHLTEHTGPAPVTAAWKALAPGAAGFRWQLKVTGPGIDLQARMTLQFNLSRTTFDNAKGTIDLSRLGAAADDLEGIIDLTGLSMAFDDIWITPRASGSAIATWRGARFQGENLGNGPVRAELDPLQSWRAYIDLKGGITQVQATLSGRMPRPVISLDIKVSDDPSLPDHWRRVLALAGVKNNGVWTLRQKTKIPTPNG